LNAQPAPILQLHRLYLLLLLDRRRSHACTHARRADVARSYPPISLLWQDFLVLICLSLMLQSGLRYIPILLSASDFQDGHTASGLGPDGDTYPLPTFHMALKEGYLRRLRHSASQGLNQTVRPPLNRTPGFSSKCGRMFPLASVCWSPLQNLGDFWNNDSMTLIE